MREGAFKAFNVEFGTSALEAHLKGVHKVEWNASLHAAHHGIPSDSQELVSWFTKSAAPGNGRGNNYIGALYALEAVTMSFISFQVAAEAFWMRELVEQSGGSCPSRSSLSARWLPRMYGYLWHEHFKQMQAELYDWNGSVNSGQVHRCLSISFDLWTSRSLEGFLSIGGSYLTRDFILRKPLLYFGEHNESHSAANVSEWMNRALDDWGACKYLRTATSDGASAATAAGRLLSDDAEHSVCFDHSLALAVKHAVEGKNPPASAADSSDGDEAGDADHADDHVLDDMLGDAPAGQQDAPQIAKPAQPSAEKQSAGTSSSGRSQGGSDCRRYREIYGSRRSGRTMGRGRRVRRCNVRMTDDFIGQETDSLGDSEDEEFLPNAHPANSDKSARGAAAKSAQANRQQPARHQQQPAQSRTAAVVTSAPSRPCPQPPCPPPAAEQQAMVPETNSRGNSEGGDAADSVTSAAASRQSLSDAIDAYVRAKSQENFNPASVVEVAYALSKFFRSSWHRRKLLAQELQQSKVRRLLKKFTVRWTGLKVLLEDIVKKKHGIMSTLMKGEEISASAVCQIPWDELEEYNIVLEPFAHFTRLFERKFTINVGLAPVMFVMLNEYLQKKVRADEHRFTQTLRDLLRGWLQHYFGDVVKQGNADWFLPACLDPTIRITGLFQVFNVSVEHLVDVLASRLLPPGSATDHIKQALTGSNPLFQYNQSDPNPFAVHQQSEAFSSAESDIVAFIQARGNQLGISYKPSPFPYLPAISETDCLSWWRLYGAQFPAVRDLARCELSQCLTSVEPEVFFSASGRFVSPSRTELSGRALSQLMYIRQLAFQSGSSPEDVKKFWSELKSKARVWGGVTKMMDECVSSS